MESGLSLESRRRLSTAVSTSSEEEEGFGDGADLLDRLKDRRGYISVQADQGYGLGADGGLPTAEGEGGDVDAELAEGRAYLADHAGFVAVAEVQNGAFELRFHGYPVYLQYAGGAVVQNRAFHGEFRGWVRGGLVRQDRDLKSVGEAVLAAACFLFDGKAARRSHLRGVDHVYFLIEDHIQQAGKYRATKQMRADLGNFASIADPDASRARLRGLRYEGTEALRQRHVRPPAAVLVGGERREVHGVANYAFGEVIADLHGDLCADFFLRFGGGAGHMRSGDHVGQTGQERIFGRLLDKDVEGGT